MLGIDVKVRRVYLRKVGTKIQLSLPVNMVYTSHSTQTTISLDVLELCKPLDYWGFTFSLVIYMFVVIVLCTPPEGAHIFTQYDAHNIIL